MPCHGLDTVLTALGFSDILTGRQRRKNELRKGEKKGKRRRFDLVVKWELRRCRPWSGYIRKIRGQVPGKG